MQRTTQYFGAFDSKGHTGSRRSRTLLLLHKTIQTYESKSHTTSRSPVITVTSQWTKPSGATRVYTAIRSICSTRRNCSCVVRIDRIVCNVTKTWLFLKMTPLSAESGSPGCIYKICNKNPPTAHCHRHCFGWYLGVGPQSGGNRAYAPQKASKIFRKHRKLFGCWVKQQTAVVLYPPEI